MPIVATESGACRARTTGPAMPALGWRSSSALSAWSASCGTMTSLLTSSTRSAPRAQRLADAEIHAAGEPAVHARGDEAYALAEWRERVQAVVCRIVVDDDEVVRRMRRQQQRAHGQKRVVGRAVVEHDGSQAAARGPGVRGRRVRRAHRRHVVFERAHGRNALPERAEQRRFSRPGAASARRRSVASPGSNSRPLTPSVTVSGMPPMRDATTGTPARNASRMTSGLFSGQIDGTTSDVEIRRARAPHRHERSCRARARAGATSSGASLAR